MVLQFSSHGIAKEAATLLERIWLAEAGKTAEKPNFLRMVQDGKNKFSAGCRNAAFGFHKPPRDPQRQGSSRAAKGKLSTPQCGLLRT